MLKRYLLSLLGYHDWPDDLEDTVPDDIGVSGPILELADPRYGSQGKPIKGTAFGKRFWYLTATYGAGDDHQHIEIKLDRQRLEQLWDQVNRTASH